MKAELSKGIRFSRCPRCNAVVKIGQNDDVVTCEKCHTKIKIKR